MYLALLLQELFWVVTLPRVTVSSLVILMLWIEGDAFYFIPVDMLFAPSALQSCSFTGDFPPMHAHTQ